MTMGTQLGLENPHVFTSCTELAAATLNDGALWIVVDVTTGQRIDAGIWPELCRNGGNGNGGCCYVVLENVDNWVYVQNMQSLAGQTPMVPIVQNTYVIANATPPPP